MELQLEEFIRASQDREEKFKAMVELVTQLQAKIKVVDSIEQLEAQEKSLTERLAAKEKKLNKTCQAHHDCLILLGKAQTKYHDKKTKLTELKWQLRKIMEQGVAAEERLLQLQHALVMAEDPQARSRFYADGKLYLAVCENLDPAQLEEPCQTCPYMFDITHVPEEKLALLRASLQTRAIDSTVVGSRLTLHPAVQATPSDDTTVLLPDYLTKDNLDKFHQKWNQHIFETASSSWQVL